MTVERRAVSHKEPRAGKLGAGSSPRKDATILAFSLAAEVEQRIDNFKQWEARSEDVEVELTGRS